MYLLLRLTLDIEYVKLQESYTESLMISMVITGKTVLNYCETIQVVSKQG